LNDDGIDGWPARVVDAMDDGVVSPTVRERPPAEIEAVAGIQGVDAAGPAADRLPQPSVRDEERHARFAE
jgi:hypothetical protein